MSANMTVRLEPHLKQRLDDLAQATEQSQSFLVAEAIRLFVDLNEWQMQEVRDAIIEADSGDFASGDAVRKVWNSWGVDAGNLAQQGAAKS